MADHFGYRIVSIVGFLVLTIVLPLFALAESPTQAMLLLVPVGLVFSAPTGPLVVLGQSYLPNRVGLASGVTLGLAFSFGGIMMPLLGTVADHHGLRTAIWVVALMPILCTALVLTLPGIESATHQAKQRDVRADIFRKSSTSISCLSELLCGLLIPDVSLALTRGSAAPWIRGRLAKRRWLCRRPPAVPGQRVRCSVRLLPRIVSFQRVRRHSLFLSDS